MNDIVIPYRKSYSDELRYTLRSLQNIPHRDVYIIGDKTKFRVNHVYYTQTVNTAKNTLSIIDLAVNTPDISEDFIYMHDDMYILKPITRLEVHHRGLYVDIINNYQQRDIYNFYVERMRRTYNKLLQLEIKQPLCYELHIPFMINKTKWRAVRSNLTPQLNKLSMYGNLNHIGGTTMPDVKVRTKNYIPDDTFISTHDASFNTGYAGQYIKELFNKPYKYEYNLK